MTRIVPLSLLVIYTLVAAAPLQARHATAHACHETAAPQQPTNAAHHHGHDAPEIESPEAASEWSAAGRYLDTCRCNAPCPCHFGVGKDYETCDPALVYQVREGRFEGTRLDGLTVAVVATPRFARIYLDDRADEVQARGLETLARHLTGTLLRGGFNLAADQSVTRHPIHVTLTDERAEVAIPGILEIAAERLIGGDGTDRIVLRNMDLGPSWMDEVWAGRSVSYRYQDAAAWEYTGRNAYFGRFSAEGPAAPAEAADGRPR